MGDLSRRLKIGAIILKALKYMKKSQKTLAIKPKMRYNIKSIKRKERAGAKISLLILVI